MKKDNSEQVGHCGQHGQQVGHCGQQVGHCGQHAPKQDVVGRFGVDSRIYLAVLGSE